MGKGRTTSPLTIQVPVNWLELPAMKALEAQGHTIVPVSDVGVDLVLGPKSWQMTEMLLDYLPAALTAARARRKGR